MGNWQWAMTSSIVNASMLNDQYGGGPLVIAHCDIAN
jgi:hypothetical protein